MATISVCRIFSAYFSSVYNTCGPVMLAVLIKRHVLIVAGPDERRYVCMHADRESLFVEMAHLCCSLTRFTNETGSYCHLANGLKLYAVRQKSTSYFCSFVSSKL